MKSFKLLSIMILAATIAACGPKGAIQQKNQSTNNNGQSDENSGDTTQAWTQMKTETDSAPTSGSYANTIMISIDQTRQTLNLSLPLPPLAVLPVSLVAFKELPGTTIQSETLADGTEVWVLAIPLKYVLRGAQLSPMGVLPNGDPLPFFPAGEANGFSVSLPQNPKHKITIYLAVGAAAVFIETPNWEFPAGTPAIWALVKNRAKTRQIGFLQIVPNKGNFSSGVYLAAKLPADIARALGTIVKF